MKRQRNTNSNRSARMASTVQTLVAEILRDRYSDDKIIGGVSLVDAVAHGGIQYVHLYYYSRNPDIASVQKNWTKSQKQYAMNWHHAWIKNMFRK